MSRSVYYLFVKKPHFDSYAMVPVLGIDGDKQWFKEKGEPFFDEHVRTNYPYTTCEIRTAPILAECMINIKKAKIIKTYQGGFTWKKVKKLKSLL